MHGNATESESPSTARESGARKARQSVHNRRRWHVLNIPLAAARTHFIAFLLLCATLFASAASAQDSATPGPSRERFVPADQLDAIFERSPKGVMLPREEFQQLLNKAQQAQAQHAGIPAGVVLRSAIYEVEQADNHALVKLSVDIEQFADHWVTLHMPIGNLLIEEATIGGTPAAIGRDPQQPGMLTLVHHQPGRFTLKLTLSSPLGTVGSDRVAAFQIISNITSVVNAACPKDRHLEVNDLKLERTQPLDQPAKYSIPTGSSESIRLKWTARQQKTDTQSLVFARTDAQVQVSSDNVRWNSDTRVSVFGNSINQLSARVPGNMEITAVDSTGLESWKLEDDPARKEFTRLLLNYRQPFTEDRLVRISAVAALSSDADSKVPTLEFIDVTSHAGRLYVSHEDQLRLMAKVGGGIRHLGTSTQSSDVPAGEVFDFWLQEFDLSVAVKPRDRELFAELNSTLSIVDTTASFDCEVTVETLNAPLFELSLLLPEGWQIGQIKGEDGAPLKWRPGSQDGRIVIEPATPIAAGGLLPFTVPFTKTIGDPATQQLLPLPVLTAEDTLVVGGTYQITAASDLTIAPLEISGLAPIGDDGGTLLFETQGTTYSGQLSVVRKPVRLSSRSVLKSWMDTRQKTVEVVVTVDVISGTTRTMQLILPEDLGQEARFSVVSIVPVPGMNGQQVPESVAIIEQTPGEAVDGQRTFQLTFDKRFAGAVTLRTIIQLPRQDDTKLTAPFAKVVGAIRQHGLVAFEAYPEQQLSPLNADISESGLKVTDSGLVDAPSEASGRRTALVYRFVQSDYSLDLQETRFETEVVPSAVCETITNISVLGDGGTVQRACGVQLRCVGVQTLRFALPDAEHSYLWSTILNGEAVEVRSDGDDYLVAIPTGSERTFHVLEVLFKSEHSDVTVLGRTTQQSLRLSIDTDDGQASPIDILQQTWEVRYPSSAMLVNHDGGFRPLQGVQQPGWLQSIASQLSVPSWNETLDRLIPVGMMLLILFVVTALVVRRRWKSLVCVCLLGLIAVPVLLTGSRSGLGLSGGTNVAFDVSPASGNASTSSRTSGAMHGGMSKIDELAAVDYEQEIDGLIVLSDGAANTEGMQSSPRRFGVPGAPSGMPAGGGFGGGNAAGMESPADMPIALSGDGGEQQGQEPGGSGLQNLNELWAAPAMPVPPIEMRDSPGPMVAGPGTGRVDVDGDGWIDEVAAFGVQQLTVPTDADSADYAVAAGRRAGAARLSIRAHVAKPEDYSSLQFRSIGATQDAGILQVVVQERSKLKALRFIAASLVVLLCLWVTSSSLSKKLCLAVVLLLSAAAAVSLVPNQWQSIVDGVAAGTLVGMTQWTVCGIVCWIKAWCSCFRKHGCCGFFKPRNVTTALILLTLASPAAQEATAAPQDEAERTTRPDVVLPYSRGRSELLADRVFLPREEFLKLYQQAYPGELKAERPPSDNKVVAAFYKSGELKQIEDSNWSQTFTVRYVIRGFSDDPATVNLPVGAVAIRAAMLNGKEAILLASSMTAVPLLPQPPNQPVSQQVPQQQVQQKEAVPTAATPGYSVRISAKGLHLLDLVFEVPATVENSVGRLNLPLQPVAAGTVLFELPEEKLEARVNGRSTAFRKDGATLTIPISAAGNTRIDWRPATTQTADDTIYHATVNSALMINDAGLTVQTSAKINCRQGQLAEVQISLPRDYAVQKVEGADIAGWNVSEDDPGNLKLLFRQPVEGETNIDLTLFRQQVLSTEETNIEIPIPSVAGASRDSGNVTVLAGRELELRVNSLSGVSQMNAAESTLPNGVDKNLRRALAWRYTRHPVAVSVRAFRTASQLKITALNGVQLEPQRQLWTTLISASIAGAPRRRLEIQVPQDFLALDVTANDLADWYYTDSSTDPTAKILNIQFSTAKLGVVNAVIQGQSGHNADVAEARIVAPQVLSADETVTHASVWLDAASEISSSTADGWRRTGSDTRIDARILQLKPHTPEISFISENTSLQPISLTLRQAPASLIAESVSVTNVTDTSVELTLGLNWRISRAATRELSFTLPAALSEVFDFQVPGLRQLEKQILGDRVQVTLHLQQPVSERFFVLGTGFLPLPETKQILAQPPQFTVKASSKASVASQSHFWVIVNQSAGLLEAVDMQTDGNDVAPDEMKTKIPEGFLQQSVAIRRLRAEQPNSAWQLKFPERQQVAPAVVSLAAHTTIIAADGTWRSRHTLQVRNESRQFLPVVLPPESRILFCLVKGKPTRVVSRSEDDRTLHLIPVPQSGEVATPFEVQFALSGRLPTVARNLTGETVGIPAPSFPEYRDFPNYGITVARNTWSVYVPEEWQAHILKDPRRTNVVIADEDDFEDAVLLSAVDNVKSMLNYSRSLSTESAKGGMLWSEIQKQQSVLRDQRGNTAVAEGERTEALQELEQLLGEQGQLDGFASGNELQSFNLQSSGANAFLEIQDATQNFFNAHNNGKLFMSNSAQGITAAGEADARLGFQFTLPDPVQIETENKSRQVPAQPTTAEPEERSKNFSRGRANDANPAAKPGFENRSQLLDRRESNVNRQADKAKGKLGNMIDELVRKKLAESTDLATVVQEAAPDAAYSNMFSEAVPDDVPVTEGVLSLNFQIPEDGVRHDFIRPGGNATLSLTVRSNKSIDLALGILWATGCLIAAVFLLKSVSAGSGSLLLRLFVMTTILGLIGWLCFPNALRTLSLAVCIVGAGCTCITIIASGYRTRRVV